MTASHSLFFYGTLMHPEILKRVIGHQGNILQIAPAILSEYVRHHVRDCDYPALIKYDEEKKELYGGRTLGREEKCVRGTLVVGLTVADLDLLDTFEGDEYNRKKVAVHPLAGFTSLEDAQNISASASPLPDLLLPSVDAFTYVWADYADRISPEIWSYDTFVKDKLARWVGDKNAEYLEVDKRRDMGGVITKSLTLKVPEFGHPMLEQFLFDPGFINLNNGSFGSLPRPVWEAASAMTLECEGNPDKFLRITYLPLLQEARARTAKLIGADTDEVVIVHNATMGINIVLRNFDWHQGDILVGFTTTYGAISKTMQYMADRPPHPTLSVINLIFPTTHKAILDNFRSHLRGLPRHPGQKIVAIIDGIISNPGAWLKWEEMVKICKEENVWSLVDAAHCLGQIPVNLAESQPDFWISNAHKWLFAKRSAALLYVPKRNQHVIHSSIPTSAFYVSPSDPIAPNFVQQFDWTGTQDYIPFLSINAAIDFRQAIGGEEKINAYCHDLILKGTRRMAEILGTRVLDETGEFTAHMADVQMPLDFPASYIDSERVTVLKKVEYRLLHERNCYVATYPHDGKAWLRCSAQIYNDLSDFEKVAEGLIPILAEAQAELVALDKK